MKDRKVKTFVYEAFGFPVKLINVPMRKVIGEWVLDVDFQSLQKAILRELINKQAPLSGAELKFIRKYFELSTTDFGVILGVSHASISKWENEKAKPPSSADIYIRLYALDYLRGKDREFRNLYSAISPESLERNKKKKLKPLSINVEEELEIA